ncbi:MAG TPA: response regulator transcription factor, partial [Candidatus Pelethocola excrementipullorum]|nr:response regulator transcription factor [Candidatus Pelethocola excrementipullorum]
IIMLTSSQSETDELLSLSYGADDYITKRFNPQILLLRIERIINRMKGINSNYLSYHNLKLNLYNYIIECEDNSVELSKNEMKIFSCLLKHQGTIVTREEIMDELWGSEEFIDDNTLTVNITRIRRKLKELGYEDVIQTRRGQGYIIL